MSPNITKLYFMLQLMNGEVFETDLIEGRIEGNTSIICQEKHELTPKDKAKVNVYN